MMPRCSHEIWWKLVKTNSGENGWNNVTKSKIFVNHNSVYFAKRSHNQYDIDIIQISFFYGYTTIKDNYTVLGI